MAASLAEQEAYCAKVGAASQYYFENCYNATHLSWLLGQCTADGKVNTTFEVDEGVESCADYTRTSLDLIPYSACFDCPGSGGGRLVCAPNSAANTKESVCDNFNSNPATCPAPASNATADNRNYYARSYGCINTTSYRVIQEECGAGSGSSATETYTCLEELPYRSQCYGVDACVSKVLDCPNTSGAMAMIPGTNYGVIAIALFVTLLSAFTSVSHSA